MANWECQFCTNSNRKIILSLGDGERVLPDTVVITKNSKSVVNGCFVTIRSSDLTSNSDYIFESVTKNNLCSECLILLNSNNTINYENAKKNYPEKL